MNTVSEFKQALLPLLHQAEKKTSAGEGVIERDLSLLLLFGKWEGLETAYNSFHAENPKASPRFDMTLFAGGEHHLDKQEMRDNFDGWMMVMADSRAVQNFTPERIKYWVEHPSSSPRLKEVCEFAERGYGFWQELSPESLTRLNERMTSEYEQLITSSLAHPYIKDQSYKDAQAELFLPLGDVYYEQLLATNEAYQTHPPATEEERLAHALWLDMAGLRDHAKPHYEALGINRDTLKQSQPQYPCPADIFQLAERDPLALVPAFLANIEELGRKAAVPHLERLGIDMAQIEVKEPDAVLSLYRHAFPALDKLLWSMRLPDAASLMRINSFQLVDGLNKAPDIYNAMKDKAMTVNKAEVTAVIAEIGTEKGIQRS